MKKLLILGYLIHLLLFTIFSYFFVDPNLIYLRNIYTGFAFDYRGITTFIYSLFILSFFVFYFLFLKLAGKKLLNQKDLIILVAITIISLFFSYPALVSYDIFNYIATAKVSFYYFENPYLIMPIQFVNDPLLLFMQAANKTALYGPFWILLTSFPFILGVGQFLITLFSFKLLILAFYLLTLYLIYKVSKNTEGLILFALNPLVVFESLVGTHNDIVMMFFAIASLYLFKNKKMLFAAIFLLLSIFIKFATIFLIPVFIYLLIQKINKKEVNWDKVFLLASISMFTIFLLSSFREEIYPWYGIWFLVFIPFIKNNFLKGFYLSLSIGLLLRYIPYMYLGTYFGPTPIFKIILMLIPVFLFLIYKVIKIGINSKIVGKF